MYLVIQITEIETSPFLRGCHMKVFYVITEILLDPVPNVYYKTR